MTRRFSWPPSGAFSNIRIRSSSFRGEPDDPEATFRRKIIGRDALVRLIAQLRAAETESGRVPVIVQCHGCFDIVHPGHIRYLQFAKAQGDLLVVSITGDAGIHKGDQRPYIPEELRAENLAALEFVDFVVVDSRETAGELLAALKPDVYVKGHEYAASTDPRFLQERGIVEQYGGRVVFSSGRVVFSSTRLGEDLAEDAGLAVHRLGVVCRRHGIARPALGGLLASFRGRRVLVVGDVSIERHVLCDAGGVAAESPMMSLSELDRRDHLGGAGFIALQAAALGASPRLVTFQSAGDRSAWVRRMLADAGVEIVPVGRRPDVPIRTRFLVDDQKVLRVDRGAAHPLDTAGQRDLSDAIGACGQDADAIILLDAGYGFGGSAAVESVLSAGGRRRRFLAAGIGDLGGDVRCLRRMDLIAVSERRLRMAVGDFGTGLSAAVYELLQQTQASQMIVTVGKRGVVTFDRPTHEPADPAWNDRLRSEYLPSFARHAVDRVGGGETILTLAALARVCGASLMQAAYLAEGAAAIQIGRVGLAPVRADALARWIESRAELADMPDHPTDDSEGETTPEFRVSRHEPLGV